MAPGGNLVNSVALGLTAALASAPDTPASREARNDFMRATKIPQMMGLAVLAIAIMAILNKFGVSRQEIFGFFDGKVFETMFFIATPFGTLLAMRHAWRERSLLGVLCIAAFFAAPCYFAATSTRPIKMMDIVAIFSFPGVAYIPWRIWKAL